MDFILDLMPWWVWLLLAVATVFAIYRVFGWKAAAGVGAALLALLFYKRGRQEGRADLTETLEKEDVQRANEVRDVAADARADADRHNADPVELRTSDGWRRD